MRTRLASVATALLLATAALVGTAGTALMATITNDVCTGPGEDVSYSYDSTSLLITAAAVTNNLSTPQTVSLTLENPATGQVMFSGSQPFGTGLKTYNLSPLNLHMVPVINVRGNPAFAPPFNIACSIS